MGTKLSGHMMQVIDRLERGARLQRDGSAWVIHGVDDAPLVCSRNTLAALVRRGLVHAPGQDDLPWAERRWELSRPAQDGDETPRTKNHSLSSQALRDMIREAAYFLAQKDGFRQMPETYWLMAEREIHSNLLGHAQVS